MVDPDFRRTFQIPLIPSNKAEDKNGFSQTRINYSIATMQNKVYLYGGLNERNQVLECMDCFDAATYKCGQVKYRLEARVAGR